uniref:Uncharacterized protein n=1 Tax=Oryza sativa subsp. japonica TaxID=39947 RepID=Q6H8H2_ORYSJ|nr:hypothetical protein [Oryza sativa Japonica Group]
MASAPTGSGAVVAESGPPATGGGVLAARRRGLAVVLGGGDLARWRPSGRRCRSCLRYRARMRGRTTDAAVEVRREPVVTPAMQEEATTPLVKSGWRWLWLPTAAVTGGGCGGIDCGDWLARQRPWWSRHRGGGRAASWAARPAVQASWRPATCGCRGGQRCAAAGGRHGDRRECGVAAGDMELAGSDSGCCGCDGGDCGHWRHGGFGRLAEGVADGCIWPAWHRLEEGSETGLA